MTEVADRPAARVVSEVALELRSMNKTYGPVRANRDVSLVLSKGSVHAVLGENGAGKSTLMNVLFGVERPDSGEIIIESQRQDFKSPRDAIAAGVGMVFQHFGLVPELTGLDNISLGAEISGVRGVDRVRASERAAELSSELGLDIPLHRKVSAMSISQRQGVEILKALYRGARILILDEPTALLAPQERQGLFDAIQRLQASGVSVLFITHKLDEVDYLADDVTVMRHGEVVARHRVGQVDRETLVADMVGGRPTTVQRPHRVAGGSAMEVRGLTSRIANGRSLSDVTVDVRHGEVLGVAGLDGHGHQELCQVLAGVKVPEAGAFFLDGVPQPRWDRRTAMRNRVAYVPEDRLEAGVAKNESIAENLIANRLSSSDFTRFGLLSRARVADHATAMIADFDVRCHSSTQAVGSLSGGNVQKVVLARELSTEPEVVVVCEPTRGLDIAAIAAVHGLLSDAATRGAAVVVQSSDLDEVLALSDRILVFRDGALVAEVVNGDGVDAASLGTLMLGAEAGVAA